MAYLNQLFNACIQYILTGAFCALCVFGGVKLSQFKSKKAAAEAED